jgi:hypothetical protein
LAEPAATKPKTWVGFLFTSRLVLVLLVLVFLLLLLLLLPPPPPPPVTTIVPLSCSCRRWRSAKKPPTNTEPPAGKVREIDALTGESNSYMPFCWGFFVKVRGSLCGSVSPEGSTRRVERLGLRTHGSGVARQIHSTGHR